MHKITLKSLQNKIRTTVTIIGVVLSLAMITAVTTPASSVQNYLKNSAILFSGIGTLELRPVAWMILKT